ncbi:MAG: M20/M25/M40 family metallo-hydrolase [Clostridia bacterium]|nr:M20/M25/M40 family metallo-hydrolase [Clostridia bacterium]
MKLSNDIVKYIEEHYDEAYDLLITLAKIPAPSNHEEKRADFCKKWLVDQGAKGVYIDEALNVVFPLGCKEDNDVVVYMAHSDVVFPDTEPLPLTVEDGKIFCPGVGDDTANVIALLMSAKYIIENDLQPKNEGILFVVNSGEEGLGNLKGSKKIVEDFGKRIKEFITFDGYSTAMHNKSVGSKRYLVEIETEGGHSYGAFGNRNAIAYMASLISTLYDMKVPEKGKTTYNVGTIEGGTSVNTIAQYAKMLYEFRSDEKESLEIMEKHFEAAIEFYKNKGIKVTCTLVGNRPCMADVDQKALDTLVQRGFNAIKNNYKIDSDFTPGSTDCNIPLSQGIPAVCMGCINGGKAHTREEYIEIDSILPGIKTAFEMVLYHF